MSIKNFRPMIKLEKKTSAARPEQLAARIACMDRPSLVDTLHGLECSFKLDFSDEFLNSISLERLKHIVLAASLHDHAQRAGA
jgi:hypothetical protein